MNFFFSSPLLASKEILILPPTNNSKGTYKPNLSTSFSNKILLFVTFEFCTSFNSSYISLANFISFWDITILNKLIMIEWIQWIFDFVLKFEFNSSSLFL